jgi:sulfopyruvate decarboxylase TPP-binding subunit
MSAFDGPAVVAALKRCGITHVVWVPDSNIGTWEPALLAESSVQLIRVCREGEAVGVAAGLLLGGKRPIVLIQCTGLFEAGDSLRNVVHDMGLPLFLFVGLRSHLAAQKGKTSDTCPRFSEPIVQAWQIPYVLLDEKHSPADLEAEYQRARAENRAGAVLWAE